MPFEEAVEIATKEACKLVDPTDVDSLNGEIEDFDYSDIKKDLEDF